MHIHGKKKGQSGINTSPHPGPRCFAGTGVSRVRWNVSRVISRVLLVWNTSFFTHSNCMDKWTQSSAFLYGQDGVKWSRGRQRADRHRGKTSKCPRSPCHPQNYKSSSGCWYHILLQQIQICTDVYMFVYVHMHAVHFTHGTKCAATFLSIFEPLSAYLKTV